MVEPDAIPDEDEDEECLVGPITFQNPECFHCVVHDIWGQLFAEMPVDIGALRLLEVALDSIASIMDREAHVNVLTKLQTMLAEKGEEILKGSYKKRSLDTIN